MNKKFLRQCIICKEIKDKAELHRITCDYKTGNIMLNNKNEYQGRSVYICKNSSCCIEKALKGNKIKQILKGELSETKRDELCNLLKK